MRKRLENQSADGSKSQELSTNVMREIMASSVTRVVLSILLGFFFGAIFMVVFNEDVVATYSTFFTTPGDTFLAAFNTVVEGYGGLLRGAIFNPEGRDVVAMFRPITETFRMAGPLIMAGLGIALGFRVGLFNIGATGQLVMGLVGATWVSTRMELPAPLHMIIAVIAAVTLAAVWGGIVGFLKARTGAHEVIVTIMLNYVAIYFFTWMLRTPSLLLAATGGGTPKSDPPAESALLPHLFGDLYKVHIGILIAIASAFAYWLLMERSSIGYRFRMVGHNVNAARAAGINVESTFVWAMAASAAFVGLAAANQGLSDPGGITTSIHADIGFDAITVALLGGNSATRIVASGLLFGAFKAGSPAMQVVGVSPEILGVVQALIVLFIAAPPLIKAMLRLPEKAGEFETTVKVPKAKKVNK
jgi:simple sugar transport system permease protein